MNVIAREREIDTCGYTTSATPSHRGSAARARKDGAEAVQCNSGTTVALGAADQQGSPLPAMLIRQDVTAPFKLTELN